MLSFQQRVDSILQLGRQITQWPSIYPEKLALATAQNAWFTEEHIRFALKTWGQTLAMDEVQAFAARYAIDSIQPKKVAVIAAGNIPLVSAHDILCVLLSGHHLVLKPSQDDRILTELLISECMQLHPEWKEHITLTDDRIPSQIDAVIATGSNNTNRYFEYYFRNIPSLLRANRNSVAIITGNETHEEMQQLAHDVFRYFGLGCRNVSKIYVPHGYDFAHFYENTHAYDHYMHHHKYANNYTYHKAIMLMNREQILDNNVLILKQDTRLASPLSVLYYEYYTSVSDVLESLNKQAHAIQCVVAQSGIGVNAVPFGHTQRPSLNDFADGKDSMAFLMQV